MSDRYEGEYQNEPEDWYPETEDSLPADTNNVRLTGQYDLSKPLPGLEDKVPKVVPNYVLDNYAPGKSLKADLLSLLHYNWSSEEADYYRSLVEEDDTLGVLNTHIFPVMERLNDWLNSRG